MPDNLNREFLLSLAIAVVLPILLGCAGGLIVEAVRLNTAVSLCRKHLPRYLPFVPPKTAAYLGFRFFRNAELKMARYLLERASNIDGTWQPKATLMLARTFIGLGNKDMGIKMFMQAVDRYPGTLFEVEGKNQIEALDL